MYNNVFIYIFIYSFTYFPFGLFLKQASYYPEFKENWLVMVFDLVDIRQHKWNIGNYYEKWSNGVVLLLLCLNSMRSKQVFLTIIAHLTESSW